MNMKRISATRSAEVKAMLFLLTELDLGDGADLGIDRCRVMQYRINSYRAQKIAKFLGKNISKSHLVKFSKDRKRLAQNDLTDTNEKKLTVDEFIEANSTNLVKQFNLIKEIFVDEALKRLG